MDLAEQLRVLQDAQGNPVKLALATVDLTFPDLPASERTVLKAALGETAIPHWFDESILAVLLEVPKQESAARIARLRKLTIVEPFRARGDNAVNVHETTRLAIRKQMAADELTRFRRLARRATACFTDDRTCAGRVEWIYHLLCDDPEHGANELEQLYRDWSHTARPEDQYALSAALTELEDSLLLQGRARVWGLIATTRTRLSRGEAFRLSDMENILHLAKSVKDVRAEAEAQALLGDAQAHGDASASSNITRRLAKQDPSNAGWLRKFFGVGRQGLGRIVSPVEIVSSVEADPGGGDAVEITIDGLQSEDELWKTPTVSSIDALDALIEGAIDRGPDRQAQSSHGLKKKKNLLR